MTRLAVGITLVSALLALAPRAVAQSSLPAPARAQASASNAGTALDKRVSLDLKAMAPGDAFKVIANAIGFTVEVASDVSAPVDIVIGNISARTALNTICESIGCSWRASGTVIHVEKAGDRVMVMTQRSPAGRTEAQARRAGVAELRRMMDQVLPADMKFDRAPLADVAARLSRATGFEITLAGGRPDQTVSGDFGGRPFSAALKTISEQLEGTVATIMIAGRTGTRTPSFKIQLGAGRKPRK